MWLEACSYHSIHYFYTGKAGKTVIDSSKHNYLHYLLIILGGMLFFFPFLGSVALFDWDEVNFAEIAREMIVTGDYLNVQINYQPFWEKPPLFIWMQVLSMKLFGINEFAARFPNAIGGIITLLVIYRIGKKINDSRMGLLWVLVYVGSLLPLFYFKSGIIDPWFNLFIFLGIYFATLYLQAASHKPQAASHKPQASSCKSPNPQILKSPNPQIFSAGLFIGLAILTKGPVGFLIFGLTAFVFLCTLLLSSRLPVFPSSRPPVLPSSRPTVLQSSRPPFSIKFSHILLFFLGMGLTGGSWFFVQIAAGNMDTVKDFIIYQVRLFNTKDAGHGGFPGYHVVILLLGVFPASAFLFSGFRGRPDETPLQKDWRRIMFILQLVVIVLFEIVKTKIVHYSSMAYFPLTYMASLGIYRVIKDGRSFGRLSNVLLVILGIAWILGIIGFTLVGLNKEWLIGSGLIKDPFAVANLAANVKWTGWETMVAGLLAVGLLAFLILKKAANKIIVLFASSLLFTFMTMTVFTGKIEGYAQRAALDFYRQRAGEECYIKTLGFKSYAHMFYGQTMPQANPKANDNDWLLNGPIDKPAYFVFKMTKKEEYSRIYPQLTILYEKNGFIFAARYPDQTTPGI